MSEHATPQRGRLRERTAEEIRVHLARRRMSAAELSRRTGLKQPYVSRRMTGEIAFDLDDLEVIARELGVKVADLIAGEDEQTTTA
ncbi:helix-turn-helix transcriptional regulator [Micromonosporaceae bacterium B7E4]